MVHGKLSKYMTQTLNGWCCSLLWNGFQSNADAGYCNDLAGEASICSPLWATCMAATGYDGNR